MRDYNQELRHADVVLWVGNEALYVWVKQGGVEAGIPFAEGTRSNIPYVPKLHFLWEDAAHYQQALRDITGGAFFHKERVLMAVPQDATTVELTALEDFVHAAMGNGLKKRDGLILFPQSVALHGSTGAYIALGRSCRCYSVSLVRGGEVAEEVLLDSQQTSRNEILGQIRAFRGHSGNMALDIFYPRTEEDRTILGLGEPVGFAGIASGNYSEGTKEFA